MENVKFFQEIKRDAETILEKCCYIMKYKQYKKNEIVFQEGNKLLFPVFILKEAQLAKFST